MKLTNGLLGAAVIMAMAIPIGCGDDSSDKVDGGNKTGGAKTDGSRTGGVQSTGGTTATGGRQDAAILPDAAGGASDGGTIGPDAPVTDAPWIDASLSTDLMSMSDSGIGGDGADARPVCGPFANGVMVTGQDAGGAVSPLLSFFVTSQTSQTGNLGGLAGADKRCQDLAAAVGRQHSKWRAYLSVEHEPLTTGNPVHARDRIGTGPWYNAKGELIATDVAGLHSRKGDPSLFVDERGRMINGQWTLSPTPNEHDILTGTNPDGTLAIGKTCMDWTSDQGPSPDGGTGPVARVGHSDGIGPSCSTATAPTDYTSWNSSHDNAGCNNTSPRGGAGRIYCFLAN